MMQGSMIDVPDVLALRDRIGEEIAVGDWLEVTQGRIQQFADATGDHQWIHLDVGRAARESPFKTTIAHGFLTLSLVSVLLRDAIRIGGLRLAVNCGLNRVRFTSPVPAGSRIRARVSPGRRYRRKQSGNLERHHRAGRRGQAVLRRGVDRPLLFQVE